MATLTQVIASVKNYLDKVQTRLDDSGGESSKTAYSTGSVAASGSVVYDAPTELAYDPTLVYIYSVGVDLKMVDPNNPTPVAVIPSAAMLDYVIGTDGKITIRNWTTSALTYHLRVTAPLEK